MYKLDNYSELPSVQGIYFIINTINQKYYLGRAVNIKERYSYGDLEFSHHNEHLKNAIIKYGRENFIIKVVEYQDISLPELIEIEQGLLDIHYGNGLCYNKSKSASGGKVCEINPNYGKKWYNNGIDEEMFSPDEEIPEGYVLGMSKQTRQKQSEARKGEKSYCYGKKIYNNGIRERYFSPNGEIPSGYILGVLEETKRKHSKDNIGRKHSEEHKQKCSESMKGENNPQYGKRIYNNGIRERFISPSEEIPEGYILGRKPISKETREKMSEANKGKKSPKCIKVITSICCYFSVKDTLIELNISKYKFHKNFKKDHLTGFYVEN